MKDFDELNKKYNIEPEENEPQEVYGAPKNMRNDSETEILFSRSNKPSYGKIGDYGGYSTTIYANGKVLREKYEFGNDQSVSQETLWLSNQGIEKILQIFCEHEEEIEAFDERMIGCYDGSMYEFAFGTKTICADNTIDGNHPIWTIVGQIIDVVNSCENKYEVKPEKNVPQKVYGVPNPNGNMDKYNIDPKDNIPQFVYGPPPIVNEVEDNHKGGINWPDEFKNTDQIDLSKENFVEL